MDNDTKFWMIFFSGLTLGISTDLVSDLIQEIFSTPAEIGWIIGVGIIASAYLFKLARGK